MSPCRNFPTPLGVQVDDTPDIVLQEVWHVDGNRRRPMLRDECRNVVLPGAGPQETRNRVFLCFRNGATFLFAFKGILRLLNLAAVALNPLIRGDDIATITTVISVDAGNQFLLREIEKLIFVDEILRFDRCSHDEGPTGTTFPYEIEVIIPTFYYPTYFGFSRVKLCRCFDSPGFSEPVFW